MRGQFFSLDLAVGLFFLVFILQNQANLQLIESPSNDIALKTVGQDILNAMEKTGYIDKISQGEVSSNEVKSYVGQLLPLAMAANFSLVAYEYDGEFNEKRTVATSTGAIYAPYAVAKRVALVPRKSGDYYAIAQITVGYS
ncbi:MAG: hypothetical protein V1644_01710 [Candidatus Micrarchaeota archaeon]